MKTKKIGKTSDAQDILKIENPPYAVIGNTSIPSSFSISLSVGGIKKIIADFNDNDILQIEIFSGYKATEFTVVTKPKTPTP